MTRLDPPMVRPTPSPYDAVQTAANAFLCAYRTALPHLTAAQAVEWIETVPGVMRQMFEMRGGSV